jgi:hypothetical protein
VTQRQPGGPVTVSSAAVSSHTDAALSRWHTA